MHAKSMVVDDSVAAIGTANFDNRSFRLNFEVTALVADEDFVAEVATMSEADFSHSVPIDPAAIGDAPLWWRLGVNLSRLAAPVP